MKRIDILPGQDKHQRPECFEQLSLHIGELYTIVGDTGSGKSRLIRDIEQLADGDSVTKRVILMDGIRPLRSERQRLSSRLIAHLSQNMRFNLDTSVSNFIRLHNLCREKDIPVQEVLDMANHITPEAILAHQNLNTLSGGQSRALMIADIALICDSPIVLIDEIENAGIDKVTALNLLLRQDKLVLVVTHDIQTALMSKKRIVLSNGAICSVVDRTPKEEQLYDKLCQEYKEHQIRQQLLRKGSVLV